MSGLETRVTLTGHRSVEVPGGVSIDIVLRIDPNVPWDPDRRTYDITIRSADVSEPGAALAYQMTLEALREALA